MRHRRKRQIYKRDEETKRGRESGINRNKEKDNEKNTLIEEIKMQNRGKEEVRVRMRI